LFEWFLASSSLWILVILFYMYYKIILGRELFRKQWVLHVLCWAVPAPFAMWPLTSIGVSYGWSGTWCGVVQHAFDINYAYLAAFICCLVFCGFYIVIIRHGRALWKHWDLDSPTMTYDRNAYSMLSPYPVIFLFMWVPSCMDVINDIINPGDPNFVIYVIKIAFFTSCGFITSVTYCITSYRQLRTPYGRFENSVRERAVTISM